jgi:hypothetical protein
MQQQQMSTGFIVDGDREMMQGQVDRRSFQSGSGHSGAAMSRVSGLVLGLDAFVAEGRD